MQWVEVSSLADLLVRSAERSPDRAALVFPTERRTYRELLAAARHIARGLHRLGVRRGEHVGLLMPNCTEYVESLFAVALLGAVAVPINTRYRTVELRYLVQHADLVAVLTTDRVRTHVDFAELLRDTLPGLTDALDPTRLELPEAPALRTAVMLRGGDESGLLGRSAFDQLAGSADAGLVDELHTHVRLRDVAMIVYTSGTTSHPKGCMLTHEAVTRTALARVTERFPRSDPDVFWASGPLFHIAAMAPFLAAIGLGGTYVTDTYFDAAVAVELMVREGVTSMWPTFPAVMQALLEQPGFVPATLPRLQSILLIGPPALTRRGQLHFPGTPFINMCGMTETAAMYAVNLPTDSDEQRATTGGTPLRGIEVRLVDVDTGLDLPAGDRVGELLVRGYCTMEGYYRDPDQTALALDADDWLHTGDLYTRSISGHLAFNGRLKDMLKVGGENVAAIEVESLLVEHPAVKVAEVVGAPDERLDEVPVAFVELHRNEHTAAEDLIAFCRGRIASFKVPRDVHFLAADDWPMSATKIDKVALRRRVAALAEAKESAC